MDTRVVVTAAAMRTPFGSTKETLEGIREGKSAIQRLPEEFKLCPTQIGGLVSDTGLSAVFDERIARRIEARSTKPSQFSHSVVAEALNEAGLLDNGKIIEHLQTRTGISLGTGIGSAELIAQLGVDMYLLEEALGTDQFPSALDQLVNNHRGSAMQILPDSSAYLPTMPFGIRGPTDCSIKACATGAGNIRRAMMEIQLGHADIMVAGGTESLSPYDVLIFNVLNTRRAKALSDFAGALSKRNDDPGGASRPFDTGHDGFVPSEGSAVLVLEEYGQTKNEGTILAEIVGYGETTDAQGTTDPTQESQERAMRMALDMANLSPYQIDAISTHGTSTNAGDGTELLALRAVFGDKTTPPIYAIKSQVGHTLGASGSVAAVVAVLTMQDWWMPGTLNLMNPIPEMVICGEEHTDHENSCYLRIPRASRKAAISRTLINSFGFGGQNVCLIIEKFE